MARKPTSLLTDKVDYRDFGFDKPWLDLHVIAEKINSHPNYGRNLVKNGEVHACRMGPRKTLVDTTSMGQTHATP